MKKQGFKFLLFTLISLTSIETYAFDAVVDGIRYNFSGTNAKVIDHGSRSENVKAYTGAIIIPNSVTYFGTTYSVTSIGRLAFYGCSGLTSVVIPNSVTSIGRDAFQDCSNLTEVHISDIETWCNIKFEYHNPLPQAYHLFINDKELTDLAIPNSVTSIDDYKFRGCSGLTSVTIPNSVTSIGYGAFMGCSGMMSVTIPNSVTTIGDSAFSGCSGLTSVTIPNSVTTLF